MSTRSMMFEVDQFVEDVEIATIEALTKLPTSTKA